MCKNKTGSERYELIGLQGFWDFHVDTRFVDRNRIFRPDALMGFNQEAGEHALTAANLRYERLYSLGVVFMLTNVELRFLRPVKLGEHINVHTWHRESRGALFYRDTAYRDDSGELAATVIIACCAVNPETYKILRSTALDALGVTHAVGVEPLGGKHEKINLPPDAPKLGEYLVRWGDIDLNDHVNNARYLEILSDFAIGGEADAYISRLHLQYRKECRHGELLSVFGAETERGSTVYVLRGEEGEERVRAEIWKMPV
ncbi:MAG: hypothetical protein LBL82_00765 [Oscillospiraceae bacterium]|jgi:acyl-CoA thioesterase FadM|nr:hypothetical protein [Oscillospiraceae bacterium]